jgi:undecaprenyl pyrophosphate synthase
MISPEDRARRAEEKHDAMVAANRELQEEVAQIQADLQEAIKHLRAVCKAHNETETANYWLNKVRTDDDEEDAHRMIDAAHDLQHETVRAVAKYLLDRTPDEYSPERHVLDEVLRG